MLGYIRGTLIAVQTATGSTTNRTILTIDVQGLGYELQIVPRAIAQLPTFGESVQIFTHLQIRDEVPYLYGFLAIAERDLFRQLTAVSGIGSQLALALLDTLTLPDLIQAIVTSNITLLSKTPGVGKKTAERISLELRTKLAQWRSQIPLDPNPPSGLTPTIREDLEMTLFALGYDALEIGEAIAAISSTLNTDPDTDADVEAWIKAAITWLSRHT